MKTKQSLSLLRLLLLLLLLFFLPRADMKKKADELKERMKLIYAG
jgi:hypothetical protein